MERRFGRYGIPNLIMYIVAGRGLAYLLSLKNPDFPNYLVLDPVAVRHGEVWRLFTYVFLPPQSASAVFTGPLMAIFALYVTFLLGRALEDIWGSFKFTLYYLIGVVATSLVAFLVSRAPVSPYYIDLSLLLAFATVFPEFTFLLFFIIPFKAKWMGWLTGAIQVVAFAFAGLSGKLAIAVSLSNYLLFFWPEVSSWVGRLSGKHRQAVIPGAGLAGAWRASLATGSPPPVHRCSVCRKTERDNPELEFRICACPECGDGREFCMEHLKEHVAQRGSGGARA
jgi:membrane associated rhomboid family serine protease